MTGQLAELPESADDEQTGLKHRHVLEAVSTLRGLQSAHKWLHWDVERSRIVFVKSCGTCGEHDRESVQVCAEADCTSHAICQRPYG
jgi:hypothetical protein